ncbi:hypothetical protein DQ04_12981030 [Trypanosoma grayi]|uniref:hypothetical protein n=1 Tax=Trypanosoma grayi TaxID=71804 RepID=UPI0004F43560|nr:hypothetical protein DQ04_12981030 [Trypanosoma grayi]KEG06637.1 hypothetical protein DQ04_12981030 [Trypanosoma grayi]
MLERDRLAKLALWERQQQRMREESVPLAPRITAYAATLKRDGDVADRLMAVARERRERELKDAVGGTDASPLRPRRRSGGGASPRGKQQQQQQQESLLLLSMEERQRQYRLRREKKIRDIVEAERRLHTPTINPVSEMIAAGLPISSTERLMVDRSKRDNVGTRGSKSGVLASSHGSSWRDNADESAHTRSAGECLGLEEYVSPILSPSRSGTKASTLRDVGDIYERMCCWKKLRDEKVQRLRNELLEGSPLQQQQSEGENALPASPAPRPAKVLPGAQSTPRALTVGTEGSSTPVVLSLAKRYTDTS